MEITYNCWHGCHKKSEGCLNCYVYRVDKSIGKDANVIYKTKSFYKPINKNKNGEYKYPDDITFNMCFSSDFFIEEADIWRTEVLSMIKERDKCNFFCITKRPERIKECIPNLSEYNNLIIYCTMENQKRYDERAPIYLTNDLSIKGIMIEPMLEKMDIRKYLNYFDVVSVGGESGDNARTINFDWVKDIKKQCDDYGVKFSFHQTGRFILVDNKLYEIPRNKQHSQAKKAFKN